MSKLYRISNPEQPSTSAAAADVSVPNDADWDKCVLCQEATDEVLKSPASKRSIDGVGYKTLANHLLAFKEINCLPLSIVSRLTEGEDLQPPSVAMMPNGMTAVGCSTIKPNSNELQSDRRHRRKVLLLQYLRSTLVIVQSRTLVTQSDASSVGNQLKIQNRFITPQHLVSTPVLDNVPCNYKTKN